MTPAVGAADSERAAIRAYLLGADDECAKHWEAAHRVAYAAGDPGEAARYAFWLGFGLLMRGQAAPANGWLSRAEGLVAERALDCPASGYVLIPRCLVKIDGGDAAGGARDGGPRHRDRRAVRRCGSPCIRRARAWSGAHRRWSAGHGYCTARRRHGVGDRQRARPDRDRHRVLRGDSCVHGSVRSAPGLRVDECACRMVRFAARHGAVPWAVPCAQVAARTGRRGLAGAMASAQSASRSLANPPHPAMGLALYQEGEMHRLLGDSERAETLYRQAGRHGYDPMPGLALLALARGDGASAAAMIRRALDECGDPGPRPSLLSSAVEIYRATGDFAAAGAAADKLAAVAARSSSVVLHAVAIQARGAVLLAAGDAPAALAELRVAAQTWQELQMPYDAAKAAVLRGLACTVLGDQASAEIEFDSARDTFSELGATTDLAHVSSLAVGLARGRHPATTLSVREREVLTHLAAGRSNREIAEKLVRQPPHRRPPRRAHLRQARRQQPHCGNRLRLRASPRLTRMGRLTHPL